MRIVAIAIAGGLMAGAWAGPGDVRNMRSARVGESADLAWADRAPFNRPSLAPTLRQPLPVLYVAEPQRQDAWLIAESLGLGDLGPMGRGRRLRATSVDAANAAAARLESLGAFRTAFVDAQVMRVRRFVPNDPYFGPNQPENGWPGQWYLKNQIGGVDIGISHAWESSWTGKGVLIGIADDGFERTHPEFSGNYSNGDSYDFGQNDTDASPVYEADVHGTAVAGLIVARGGNGIGIVGAAPSAAMAGLRLDFEALTISQLVSVITHRSNASNNRLKIKNHSYGLPVPFAPTPQESTAIGESAAVGTVHVWAAGNARGTSAQDANKEEVLTQPGVIAVSAVGSDGKFADYSSFGANIFCTAPSDTLGQPTVISTDRLGEAGYNSLVFDPFPDLDYVSEFGGTSASAPLVAGALAAIREIRTDLTGRMAKHLLVRSCDVVDPMDSSSSSDSGWRTNAAGNKFNQNYGFGLVNAKKLVNNAWRLQSVSALTTQDTGTVAVGQVIPDNNNSGVTRTFDVNSTTPLEEVLVTLNITGGRRGDYEAYLVSPSGTATRLFLASNSDNAGGLSWTFAANAFWGENPNGTWVLRVRDVLNSNTGTWADFRVVTRHGTATFNLPTWNAQFLSQEVPTSMAGGVPVNVKVRMRNTGMTDWRNVDGVYLVSQNPYANDTWGRVTAKMTETEVKGSGEYKEFVFRVTPPLEQGVYNFRWQMRWGLGKLNFGDLTPNVAVTVTQGNDAEFVSQTVPTTMKAGQRYDVSITMRNTGGPTWTRADTYILVPQNPYGNTTWGAGSARLSSLDSIATGQTKTFAFSVVAPTTPGTYNFQRQMRRSNIKLNFGELTPNVVVNVTP